MNPRSSHDDTVRLGKIAGGLGQTLRSLGSTDEAEPWIRRGVEVLEGVAGADRELLTAQMALAGFLNARGDKDEAVELYEEILDRQRAVLGPDHVDVAYTLNNLGYVHRTAGRNREAADLYRQGAERVAAIYGRGHPETLMFAGNLATALSQAGALDEAVEVYRDNVRAAELRWPDGHWRLAREYMNLGGGLLLDGRFGEAVEPLRRSVEMNAATLGADHPETPVLRAWMGAALALSGRNDEAAAAFADAVAALEGSETFPDNGPARGMLAVLVNHMREWAMEDAADRFASFVE